jgi:hypothetical protein
MRRLLSLVVLFALAGCGGTGRSVMPPASGPGGAALDGSSASRTTERSRVQLSSDSLTFTSTGWHATKIVTTTWRDGSRKSAVSSDTSVAVVTPPFQLAEWTAPNRFTASYWITPVGPGSATITFSDHRGRDSAQLTVTVSATPAGTLYLASNNVIGAYPLGANGPTAPERTITGFTGRNSEAVEAIATAATGELWVVQDAGTSPLSARCNVIVESATAAGTSGVLNTFACQSPTGEAIARGANGQMDVVVDVGCCRVVRRFLGSTLVSTFTPPAMFRPGIATDAAGDLYVVTASNRVDEFAPNASDGAAPLRTITFAGGYQIGAIAAAPDGTLHVMRRLTAAGSAPEPEYIDTVLPGATTPSRSQGPWIYNDITALACDDLGELYVAMQALDGSGAGVRVFPANASGKPPPLRIIPSPGGAAIKAMAIFQDAAPPEPI